MSKKRRFQIIIGEEARRIWNFEWKRIYENVFFSGDNYLWNSKRYFFQKKFLKSESFCFEKVFQTLEFSEIFISSFREKFQTIYWNWLQVNKSSNWLKQKKFRYISIFPKMFESCNSKNTFKSVPIRINFHYIQRIYKIVFTSMMNSSSIWKNQLKYLHSKKKRDH